jgi:O-antigen/teichoic acid export membrane protein
MTSDTGLSPEEKLRDSTAQTKQHKDDAVTLARGSLANYVGGIGRLSRVAAIMIIARAFGPEVLGLYALAWLFMGIMSFASGLGQDHAIIYFLSADTSEQDESRRLRLVGASVFLVVIVGALLGTGIYFSAGLIAKLVFSDPRIEPVLRVLAFGLPIMGVTSVLLAATRVQKVMLYQILATSFVQPIAFLIGATFTVYMDGGLIHIAMTQVFALYSSGLASIVFFGRVFPIGQACIGLFQPRGIQKLLSYGGTLAGRSILGEVVARMDMFLVGHVLGAAYAGIYNVAFEASQFVRSSRRAVDPIFGPMIAEQYGAGDRTRLAGTYARGVQWLLTINLLSFGVLVLAGETVLRLYGAEYVPGYATLVILAAAQAMNGALGLSETVLLMAGRPGILFWNTVLLLAMVTGMVMVFINVWGIAGAATGLFLAILFIAICQVFQVLKVAHIHPFNRQILVTLSVSAIALVAAYILPLGGMPYLIQGITRAAIYLIASGTILVHMQAPGKITYYTKRFLPGLRRERS